MPSSRSYGVRSRSSKRSAKSKKIRGLVRPRVELEPAEAFRFVKAHQAMHGVRALCRALSVSPSGYYAWLDRAPSARAKQDAELLRRIHVIHAESRATYGSPRVHAMLAIDEVFVGRKRVERLMKAAGLEGVCRRKKYKSTRDKDARPAPDLVEREFGASAPNQLWVADITYVPTWAGFLYLAVVLDVFSRRIVGWAMDTHLRTELVVDALNMAIGQRQPATVIHHSDQGCQLGFNGSSQHAFVSWSLSDLVVPRQVSAIRESSVDGH